jgi:hypothetical protein
LIFPRPLWLFVVKCYRSSDNHFSSAPTYVRVLIHCRTVHTIVGCMTRENIRPHGGESLPYARAKHPIFLKNSFSCVCNHECFYVKTCLHDHKFSSQQQTLLVVRHTDFCSCDTDEAPVTPTSARVTLTDDPVTPTSAPVTPTEAPITPPSAPVTPTEAPVTPTEAPVTPASAPVTPTDVPVTPTSAPVTLSITPTSAPVTPTSAPVTPTDARHFIPVTLMRLPSCRLLLK